VFDIRSTVAVRYGLFVLAIVVAALQPVSGQAGVKKSLWISTTAAQSFVGAQINNTIMLEQTGVSIFRIDFVIPRDYKENSKVTVIFHMLATNNTPCVAQFNRNAAVRSRVGEVLVSSVDGITMKGGATVAFAEDNLVRRKVLEIKPGGLPGQKPGDAVALEMARNAGAPVDDCARIHVSGIELRYTATQ